MTIKQLNTFIEETTVLKDISQSYADVASGRFKKIRNKTEKNRLYLEELSLVFKSVKQDAAQKKLLPIQNIKTISIIITSNYQFYGDINYQLIKFFLAQRSVDSDVLVIGKTGSFYFRRKQLADLKEFKYEPSSSAAQKKSKFDEFLLQKDFPSDSELEVLVQRIKGYSQILVYYSRLQSVILQIPSVTDITQTSYLKEDPGDIKERP